MEEKKTDLSKCLNHVKKCMGHLYDPTNIVFSIKSKEKCSQEVFDELFRSGFDFWFETEKYIHDIIKIDDWIEIIILEEIGIINIYLPYYDNIRFYGLDSFYDYSEINSIFSRCQSYIISITIDSKVLFFNKDLYKNFFKLVKKFFTFVYVSIEYINSIVYWKLPKIIHNYFESIDNYGVIFVKCYKVTSLFLSKKDRDLYNSIILTDDNVTVALTNISYEVIFYTEILNYMKYLFIKNISLLLIK